MHNEELSTMSPQGSYLQVGSPHLQIDFVDPTSEISFAPTEALQIVATLGVNEPPWPDGHHVDGMLREFGLVGQLNAAAPAGYVLVNLVRHVAVPKDPQSTLVRTIQLVF